VSEQPVKENNKPLSGFFLSRAVRSVKHSGVSIKNKIEFIH